MNNYQTMQAVKVGEGYEDSGRAGTVRSTERTEGSGKTAAQVVDVELDATPDLPAKLAAFPVSALVPL